MAFFAEVADIASMQTYFSRLLLETVQCRPQSRRVPVVVSKRGKKISEVSEIGQFLFKEAA